MSVPLDGACAPDALVISTQLETSRAAPTVDDDDELGVFDAAAGAEAGAWLARVVAGAADGPTAFDPFSSRKAHVLKQAKQCLEKCRAGLCGNQPLRYVICETFVNLHAIE